jgi:hypothetical protein
MPDAGGRGCEAQPLGPSRRCDDPHSATGMGSGLRTCSIFGGLGWTLKSPTPYAHAKKRSPATHPLQGDELRALRKLRRQSLQSNFMFVSERGLSFSPSRFAKIVERAPRSG